MPKRERTQKPKITKEFLDQLKAVTAKRAKTVIEHILKHGDITTEELSEVYGYDHPPRAARDVREQGIPLVTFRIMGSHGKIIGAYKFGDPSKIKDGKLGGRKIWPKSFKDDLIGMSGLRCCVCNATYESRYLQIDHRVPYEVGGDPVEKPDNTDFMLLCGSCNRAKSWSCEHCRNWTVDQVVKVCQTCYWAKPEDHAHVALRLIRRLDVIWIDDETLQYDQLLKLSKFEQKAFPEFVKDVLRDLLDEG